MILAASVTLLKTFKTALSSLLYFFLFYKIYFIFNLVKFLHPSCKDLDNHLISGLQSHIAKDHPRAEAS